MAGSRRIIKLVCERIVQQYVNRAEQDDAKLSSARIAVSCTWMLPDPSLSTHTTVEADPEGNEAMPVPLCTAAPPVKIQGICCARLQDVQKIAHFARAFAYISNFIER
jgi:hypothetical protein